MKIVQSVVVSAFLASAVACGGGSMATNGGLTVSLASGSAQVFQGQASATVNVTVTRTGSTGNVTLSVAGLPAGASDTVQSPGSGNSGSVTLSADTAAAPGTYSVTITASDGSVSGEQDLSLTIGAVAAISNNTNGPFSVAMSTSFQPAEWDYQFFTQNPGATTTLGNLGAHHTRLQGISQGIPQGSQGTGSMAWDFSILDAITQPVLGVGDHSPEFQIAKGPAFMYLNNDFNQTFVDQTYAQFAGYAQNLVRYYCTGGFVANGQIYISPQFPADTVTWWGIYNEPNINNDFINHPELYVKMYNEVVPKMKTIDPSIKFAALELADFGTEAQNYVPTFVNSVAAPVDVMATHFYSSCNQKDSDAQVLGTIPGFVSDVQFFYTQMATNPGVFANVPVWVTENNVNADYDKGGGISNCNGGPFVTDQRGSSPFFAAWRPYVFSQLGKAGVQALYHWDFEADKQYGEVDYRTGALQLSYWVDYELGQEFPPAAGSQLLQFTGSDDSELETLPVINGDGSVVIMVANHAVDAPSTDNNGPGVARTVAVDVSALGTFSSGSLLTIDKDTNVSTGPAAAAVTPAPQITLTLNGYSVAFLALKP